MRFFPSGMMLVPLSILFSLIPLAISIWLLVIVRGMSKDLATVARAVSYLADRASTDGGPSR